MLSRKGKEKVNAKKGRVRKIFENKRGSRDPKKKVTNDLNIKNIPSCNGHL
jgi:hypothetical protein